MTTATTTLSCISCHTLFPTTELHRKHYQSDWHQYNLRRRATDLPPITEAAFLQLVEDVQRQRRGEKTKSSGLPSTGQQKAQRQEVLVTGKGVSGAAIRCETCRKHFGSQNTYENHLKSQKHADMLLRKSDSENANNVIETSNDETKKTSSPKARHPGKDVDDYLSADAKESMTEEQIEQLVKDKMASLANQRFSLEQCLFCSTSSPSFEANVAHMLGYHSLYIPDVAFVKDLEGLFRYLADKVSLACCCLYCPASVAPFRNPEAVRRHMLDKDHVKIRYDEEGMDELASFYNYESVNEEAVEDDDGDEAYSDVDSLDDDGTMYGCSGVISPDDTELILPSGLRVGHRAFRVYYKQHLRPGGPVAPRDTRRDGPRQELVLRIAQHPAYAMIIAPPAVGTITVAPEVKRVQRAERGDRKEWDLKIGQRANGLQEHFRYQLRQ